MKIDNLNIKLIEASSKKTQYFVCLVESNRLLGMVSCRDKTWFASNSDKPYLSRKEATKALIENI